MQKNGTIVYQGHVQEHEITIRYPDITDLTLLCNYINELSQERTFIHFQGEEITLEQERSFLESQLKKINEKEGILLLVFSKGDLIGVSGIDMFSRTERHIGEFGISIRKFMRGKGIGSILMRTVIEQAIKTIPQLEIVKLYVFSNNKTGFEMYLKQGFKEYGRLPSGIKLEKGYVDSILMYKDIRS